WFRIIHEKVTTRRKLHHYLPDDFTLFCPHCQSAISSTTEHSLFPCPLKFIVWRKALSYYISPHFTHFAYEEYISSLHLQLSHDRSSHSLFPELFVYQVFACIQQSIWSAPYCQVFQQVPFSSDCVLLSIHRIIFILSSPLSLDSVN
ncbi:hypothetical protein BD408DRAFT_345414, partial [Parasitella parasitica]